MIILNRPVPIKRIFFHQIFLIFTLEILFKLDLSNAFILAVKFKLRLTFFVEFFKKYFFTFFLSITTFQSVGFPTFPSWFYHPLKFYLSFISFHSCFYRLKNLSVSCQYPVNLSRDKAKIEKNI